MALTAAELRAVYSVDEGPLDKSLNGMGGKVSSTFGKVAAAAAGFFAFDKLQEGFLSVTGAASDLNETVNKASVIFGANADAINQWAQGAAKNLGMSRQQALDAAAGFGDMFSQIGFSGNAAADMSKKVVQMSADLGSFNNLPTEDVAQRLSAAFRGEYDSLQALIPNINAARVESEAMAATGKKNASELTAQEKAAAVLAIVQKDGARAMGDFAKTSSGAANSAKIATAEWEDQKAAIGQQLLPVLNSLIGFLRSSVIPAVGALAGFIFSDVIPAVKDMAQWVEANKTPLLIVAGIIAAVFLPHLIALATQSLVTGVQSAAGWAMQKASAVGAAVVHSAQIAWMIVRWVALGAAAVVQGAVTAAVWTAQIVGSAIAGAASFAVQVASVVAGWVLMGAQALAQGIKIAAVWTAQVVASAVSAAASFAVQVALVVGGWVLMGVQSLLAAAKMAAAWFIALGPVGWVIAAVVALVALIVANWDTVVSWTKTAWNAVTGALSAAWNWIVGIVGNAVAVVQSVISGVWNWIKSATTGAWNAVSGAVSTGVSNVISFVRGLPGQILSAIGNLGSLLLTAGGDLLRGLWNGITGSISWLKNKIMNWAGSLLPGWVKDILGINSPSTVFAEMGRYLMLGMAQGIDTEAETAVKAAARAAEAITGAMQVSAPDLAGMGNAQAMAGLTARRPPGVGGTTPAAANTGTAAAGPGPLVNIEEYYEQPGSSPQANAQALAVEVRTRPWT